MKTQKQKTFAINRLRSAAAQLAEIHIAFTSGILPPVTEDGIDVTTHITTALSFVAKAQEMIARQEVERDSMGQPV